LGWLPVAPYKMRHAVGALVQLAVAESCPCIGEGEAPGKQVHLRFEKARNIFTNHGSI
jgi:hypothetical protein